MQCMQQKDTEQARGRGPKMLHIHISTSLCTLVNMAHQVFEQHEGSIIGLVITRQILTRRGVQENKSLLPPCSSLANTRMRIKRFDVLKFYGEKKGLLHMISTGKLQVTFI